MTATPSSSSPELPRFQALLDTVWREGKHLLQTDRRLFATPIDEDRVKQMEDDPDLAERVDAFAARFGRMQDTLGDKLLPSYLRLMGERPGLVLDNLHRAEAIGLIGSSQEWLDLRNQRNKLIHEYISNPAEFADTLMHAHQFVAQLIHTYNQTRNAAMAHFTAAHWPPEHPLPAIVRPGTPVPPVAGHDPRS